MGWALITGATSGIGRALAFEMARNGHDLVVTGRNADTLKTLKQQLEASYGVQVDGIQVDLTKQEDRVRLLECLDHKKEKLMYVINNAGVGYYGAFLDGTAEEDEEVISLNITALTALTRSVFPYLKKGAHVMEVASTAAFAPGPYMAVYYASKAYVLALGLALRHEWKIYNISVSVLCPGATKTAFIERAQMQKAKIAQQLAMTPEKVAEIGYKGMKKRKAIIIPGGLNKITAHIIDCLPSQIGTWFVSLTQRKVKGE